MTQTFFVVREMDRRTHGDTEMQPAREKLWEPALLPSPSPPPLLCSGQIAQLLLPSRVCMHQEAVKVLAALSRLLLFSWGLSGVDRLCWGKTCQQIASLLPR